MSESDFGIPDLAIARCERDCIEIVARRGQESAVAEQIAGALALGPTRWLVLAERGGAAALLDRLDEQLGGKATLIDQSSVYVTFEVCGPAAREALARLCRLDLHPTAFPLHHAARTLMAQIPVITHFADARPCFALYVPMTLSESFAEHLLIVSKAFGITTITDERPPYED